MKLSSFKVGEYAIDSDGEVVKILKKTGRGNNLIINLEEIKAGKRNPNRSIGYNWSVGNNYGEDNFNNWKRWTPPQNAGNPVILAKIQEAKKNLEDLEKAYKESMKPKIEFIPGMAYDFSECGERDWDIGIFTNIDSDGDHLFIVNNEGEYFCSKDEAQKAKPLTKPNQKKAAKIIYDFIQSGKFPEN